MKIKEGYMVKVADIGTPGVVIRTSKSEKAAVVEFDFPDGKVQGTLPVSIISNVLSRGKLNAQA